MEELLNEETKTFLAWARKNKKDDKEIVADLVRSGWEQADAEKALADFSQLPADGKTNGEEGGEENFWKRNLLLVVMTSIVLLILVAFGIFVLLTQ